MRIFIRDFVAALLIVAIPMLLAGWVASLSPWPKVELTAFLPALTPLHLIYLVPVGLLVFGLRTRNGAIIAGILAGAGVVYLGLALMLFGQRQSLRELELAAAQTPAEPTNRMLVFTNTTTCDALCVQVLAVTNYRIAMPRGKAWIVYRRAMGDSCQQKDEQRTVAMFVAAGYSGMCASSTTTPVMPDGAVISEYKLVSGGHRGADAVAGMADRITEEHPWKNEPTSVKQIAERIPAFAGTLYERGVSVGGQDQLLERRFQGRLESSAELLTFSLTPGPIQIGEDFDRAAFYGRALGVKLSLTAYPGPVDLEASLDHLEELMLSAAPPDSDVPGGDARLDLVGKFARLAWSAEGDQRVAVHERIQRLLKSGKPVLVHAGLDAMGDSARADPEEVEAALVQLLDGDNPDIVAIALRKADSQFHLADRPEIAKRLLEIPFRTELFERESRLGTPGLVLALLPSESGYDDTYRERTMDLLRSASSMVSGHCEVLLSIIAHGHDQTASKREALAALLETKDNTFSACSTVFHAHRSDLFVDEEPADVQIALLRDRAELVSPGALREYWRQFLSSKHARAMSDDHLLAIVRARLAKDQQSHALDKRALTQTQWLLGDLMKE